MEIDDKVKSFLAKVLANGLSVAKNLEQCEEFAANLVPFINADQQADIFAEGDIDGILISDYVTGSPFMTLIFSKDYTVSFRLIGVDQDGIKEDSVMDVKRLILQALLYVVNYAQRFSLSQNEESIQAGPYVPSSAEHSTEVEDDSFTIT